MSEQAPKALATDADQVQEVPTSGRPLHGRGTLARGGPRWAAAALVCCLSFMAAARAEPHPAKAEPLPPARLQATLLAVIINEFLAVSVGGSQLKDEDGQIQGWIELYNPGASPARLAGWSLTDTAGAPDRWVFPDVTVPPGGYLVVFASGKDRRPATGKLHTNFKLDPAGEYLGLFNNESPRRAVSEFAPRYAEQRRDYSYGRDPEGNWRYYATPTPGAPNGVSRLEGIAAPVHFSVERGLYRLPFQLRLSTLTSNAVIRFTTNGTLPTENNGQLYVEPLRVEHTTLVRAVAFLTNQIASVAHTHTYIFPAEVLRQPANPPGFPVTTLWSQYNLPSDYGMDPRVVDDPQYQGLMLPALQALPSLSIVMKTDDMFGAARGLYTHAGDSSLEAACSVELIPQDGQPGFQADAGIQMHGGGSRLRTLKHPFRLKFKAEYGASKLNFRFFPDSPVTEFDTIDLRADYNNHWTHGFDPAQRARGQLIRDAWFKDVQGEMGGISSHSRYVHLYINGLYWGVYNPCERPDGAFGAAYWGGTKDDYDVINGTSPSPPVDGDAAARNGMLSLDNLADPARYAQMQRYLNVPQYIDYLITQWYGANQDWGATKNWYSFRRRQPGAGYAYMCWDSERTLEGVSDNQLSVSPDNLHPKLAANAEYRILFADRVHKHFFNDGVLTTNAVIGSWMRRAAELDTAIVAESARWGDSMPKTALSPRPYPSYNPATPYNRNEDWLGEQGRLLTNYFPNRSGIVLNQLRAAGLYPRVAAPVFPQHGGRVPAGFRLVLINPGGTGTILYTINGLDPRVPGSGEIAPDAVRYDDSVPLELDHSVIVKARARDATGNWSALDEAEFQVATLGSTVRITEIMYHSPESRVYEFIELQNAGQTPVDLSLASLMGLDFVFPPGTVLAAGAVLVLIPDLNPAAFQVRYPTVSVFGLYHHSLADSGERLTLVDKRGRTVTAVTYGRANPWPSAADGHGRSLELADLNGDPADPANWRASVALGGSPGQANPAAAAPRVRLNEVMAFNATAVSNAWGFSDWVELHNPGSQAVNLAGWSLSTDGGAHTYVFPADTELSVGDFLVVWCDRQTNAPGLHAGFALDRQAETVVLQDAEGNGVDAVSFGPQVADYSIGVAGRGAGTWQLTLPTPGAANQAAQVAAATNLVLNEWMANPPPGQADWLELFNRSDTSPAALMSLYVGASNALFQIKSLAFVARKGQVRLWADEQTGPDHLGFKLAASGGRIDLFDPAGQPLDRVVYGPQGEGTSQGRLPDGAGTLATFGVSSSPGGPNYLPDQNGLILNEVMVQNRGSVKDTQGRWAGWIELCNPQDSVVGLSSMSLSAGEPHPGQWTFPEGATVSGRRFLVVWFDDSRPASSHLEPSLNTGRTLSKNHGGIYLFNAAGECVDTVAYGFQIADRAIGRTAGGWSLLDHPTPGEPNSVPATLGPTDQLRINEWMTGQPGADDWFELYNPGTRPVELTGLCLTDDPSIAGQTKSRIGPLSFIDALGWVKWVADAKAGQGLNHVNFKLDARGETLRLYSPVGELIDSIDYDVQEAGVSEGRLPDGAATIARFPNTSTPGAANTLSLPPVILVQPRGLRLPVGAEARFEVTTSGTQPLFYQWEHNGRALTNATNATLRFTSVQMAQAGAYRVVITNQAGSAASTTAWLQVQRPLTLSLPAEGMGGVLRLRVVGSTGARYSIQASTNLAGWTLLVTLDAPEGEVEYPDALAPDHPLRFYRALEEPAN